MKKTIYIVLLVVLLIIVTACDSEYVSPEKQLSEFTNQELETMIETYYEMDRVWTRQRVIIYQNELILRKLERGE